MRQFLLKSCLYVLLAACVLPAHVHAGSLSGAARWNYADYTAQEGGEDVLDAHHFWHEYSLMYRASGKILQGRGGGWSLELGGQWLGLDAEFQGGISETRFKPLYNGNLVFAPGGIPLRLTMYHRDRSRSRVISDRSLSVRPTTIDETLSSRPNILDPDIRTTILNGETVETGATLMIGIRNGSYLGRYRNVLSTLPRLLMDYRQVVVKDLRSSSPTHYRQRNLAFVSLNKKDNWFHYRYSDYRDYLDSENNYTEKQYILGTITPWMRRHWIQMTNWISVSVDGSFTQTDKAGFGNQENGDLVRTAEDGEKELSAYTLNLIGTARRKQWQGNSSVAYHRQRNALTNDIDKKLFVPLYLNGRLNPDTSWRIQFEGEQEDVFEGIDENRLFSQAQIAAFERQRHNLEATMGVERTNGINGEATNSRLSVELFTNRDHRPPVAYHLGYDLAYFSTSSRNREAHFWENTARFSLTNQRNRRLEWGLSQFLTFGTGELDRSDSASIQSVAGQSLTETRSESSQTDRSGSVFRSTSKIFSEYSRSARHLNRFELTYDFLREAAGSEHQIAAKYRYSYQKRSLRGNVRSTFRNTWLQDGSEREEIFLSGDLRYQPSRSFEAGFSLDYDRAAAGVKSNTSLTSEQSLQYTVYKINGLIRKLWQFSQSAKYQSLDGTNGGRRSIQTYRLAAGYFPWQVLALSGGVSLERLSPADTDRFIYDLACRLRMSKLQVELTYAYGTQSASDDFEQDRNEQRWELNVERAF